MVFMPGILPAGYTPGATNLETLTYVSGLTGQHITFGDDSLPNVTYKGIVGAGLSQTDNFVVDTAYVPGSSFVRTKLKATVLKALLVVTGNLQDGSSGRTSLWSTIDQILAVLHPAVLTAGTLSKVGADGTSRTLYNVQYVGGFEVEDQAANLARVELELMFEAYDPTWYSTSTHNQSIGASTDAFGFSVPITVPLVINGQAQATVNCPNAGNINAAPIFTFYGPLTNYSITNGTNGLSFAVTQDLATGDQLVVDCKNQLVTYTPSGGSQTPLYSAFGGNQQWVLLAPGTNNITFSRDAAGNNQCVASWQDSWNHG